MTFAALCFLYIVWWSCKSFEKHTVFEHLYGNYLTLHNMYVKLYCMYMYYMRQDSVRIYGVPIFEGPGLPESEAFPARGLDWGPSFSVWFICSDISYYFIAEKRRDIRLPKCENLYVKETYGLYFQGCSYFCLAVSADLNNVRFSAYRTAIKIRRLQKTLCCEFGLWDKLFLYSTWGWEGQLKSNSINV